MSIEGEIAMSEITIEQLTERQTELANLIERFKLQSRSVLIDLPACQIALRPEERYLGPLLRADGSIESHLVFIACQEDVGDHDDATAWAKSKGGELASKDREIRLVQANAADLLPSSGLCWLKERNGSSYAWLCYFDHGYVYCFGRSSKGAAVAVRRVPA